MNVPKVPQIKTPSLQTLTKVLLAVLAITGFILLVTVATQEYRTEVTQKQNAVAAEKQAKDNELSRLRFLNEKWEAAYNDERTNCEKGKIQYDKLTPAQKRLVAPDMVPKCGLAVPAFAQNVQ